MELALVVKDKLQKETGQGRGRARGAAWKMGVKTSLRKSQRNPSESREKEFC